MSFYVADTGREPGFLVYGTGFYAGKPERCPSVRHAANFDTYEQAVEAAERASLVAYAVLRAEGGA